MNLEDLNQEECYLKARKHDAQIGAIEVIYQEEIGQEENFHKVRDVMRLQVAEYSLLKCQWEEGEANE